MIHDEIISIWEDIESNEMGTQLTSNNNGEKELLNFIYSVGKFLDNSNNNDTGYVKKLKL